MSTKAIDHEVVVAGETRKVKQEGDTFKYGNGSFYESSSFMELVADARRKRLPEWAGQIPGLMARIQNTFAEEKKRGIESHLRFSNSDGKITVLDLIHGTSVSGSIDDLKALHAAGKPLPRAFQSTRAKELLGVEL